MVAVSDRLLFFYLKHVAGYPKVRLYEGAWKETSGSTASRCRLRPVANRQVCRELMLGASRQIPFVE